MYIKFIDPVNDAPHICNISDAFIANNMDEDGQTLNDQMLVINCLNDVEYVIYVQGLSFVEMNEILNEIYINQRYDLTSNTKAKIDVFPKALVDMFNFGETDEDELNIDGLDLEIDDDFDSSYEF